MKSGQWRVTVCFSYKKEFILVIWQLGYNSSINVKKELTINWNGI